MKKNLGLFLTMLLILTTITATVYAATGTPSITARDAFPPIIEDLPAETATTTASYEELVSAVTAEDGSFDLDGFAKALNYASTDTNETVFSRHYVLTRGDNKFYVMISGNVVWAVFKTLNNTVCKVQIITDPNAFDNETVSQLMYLFATATTFDARNFDIPYDYSYELYIIPDIPLDSGGRVALSDFDPERVIDLRNIKAS